MCVPAKKGSFRSGESLVSSFMGETDNDEMSFRYEPSPVGSSLRYQSGDASDSDLTQPEVVNKKAVAILNRVRDKLGGKQLPLSSLLYVGSIEATEIAEQYCTCCLSGFQKVFCGFTFLLKLVSNFKSNLLLLTTDLHDQSYLYLFV